MIGHSSQHLQLRFLLCFFLQFSQKLCVCVCFKPVSDGLERSGCDQQGSHDSIISDLKGNGIPLRACRQPSDGYTMRVDTEDSVVSCTTSQFPFSTRHGHLFMLWELLQSDQVWSLCHWPSRRVHPTSLFLCPLQYMIVVDIQVERMLSAPKHSLSRD